MHNEYILLQQKCVQAWLVTTGKRKNGQGYSTKCTAYFSNEIKECSWPVINDGLANISVTVNLRLDTSPESPVSMVSLPTLSTLSTQMSKILFYITLALQGWILTQLKYLANPLK